MTRSTKVPSGVKSTIRAAEGIAEVLLLTVLYFIFWRNGYDDGSFPTYYGMGKYVLAGVYMLLLFVLFSNFEGFRFGYLKLTDAIISQCVAIFITNFITYWQLCLIANVMISPVPVLLLMLVDAVVSAACCYLFTLIYHKLYTPKNMVMIFGRNDSVALKFKMDARPDKYHISCLIPAEEGAERICSRLENYDAVILNDLPAEIRNDILKYCYRNGIRVYVTPKLSDIIIRGGEDINLFDTPLVLVKGKGLTVPQRVIKRLLDVLLCTVALALTSPLMLGIALAIKLEDGGPVFYRQKRASLDGRIFEILKFRSMIVDAEKEGQSLPATDHDPRITRVGRFTRATRMDELPQLINILKGEMSIVGPRPERVEHMEEYASEIPEFDFRLKVKGGLTGFAQIYGKYNTSPYDKLRLDMMYIENYSLLLDIKLILMTIRIILKKDSTEGFDKAEEMEQLVNQTMEQMNQNESEEKKTPAYQ